MTTAVAAGDFFKCSWGYDQTNVDFYRVLKVSPSGKTLTVQKWAAKRDDYSDRVVPGDGPATFPKWVEGRCVDERPAGKQMKRLRFWGDRPAFTVSSYADAYLWDGRAAYETPVGAGH